MNPDVSIRTRATPMGALAASSALVLLAALVWSATHPDTLIFSAASNRTRAPHAASGFAASSASGNATSSTPLGDAIIGQFAARYRAISQSGASSSTAAQTAADITPKISYTSYAAADIVTDPDTSLKAVIRYRADMRTALAPLLNNTVPEFEIYARYVDTGDASYLDRLAAIAADYRTAIAQALRVKVPRDAASYHAGVLNAMSEFAAVLDGLARNVKDPIAAVALLRTYNAAEQDMFTSFNALGQYAAHKTI